MLHQQGLVTFQLSKSPRLRKSYRSTTLNYGKLPITAKHDTTPKKSGRERKPNYRNQYQTTIVTLLKKQPCFGKLQNKWQIHEGTNGLLISSMNIRKTIDSQRTNPPATSTFSALIQSIMVHRKI